MKNLYIILFILPLIGFGQGWEFQFGGGNNYLENGYSIKQTLNEDFIVTGGTMFFVSSIGECPISSYLLKLNSNGDTLFLKNIRGTQSSSINLTSDNGFIILGHNQCSDNCELLLTKTNSSGDIVFEKTYTYPESIFCMVNSVWTGNDVEETSDNGFVFSDFWGVYKTDSEGEILWTLWMTENVNNILNTGPVIELNDGSFIVGGDYSNDDVLNGESPWISKINNQGEVIWINYYDNLEGYVTKIQETYDNGYVFCHNNSITKINSLGDIEWSLNIGETETSSWIVDIKETPNGDLVYVNNYTDNLIGQQVISLNKITDSGEEMWSNVILPNPNDYRQREIHEFQQTSDGGFILTGNISHPILDPNNHQCSYVIKTNEWGNITSTIELPTPTSKRELVKTTNILGQENTTIKNQPLIEIYDDGSTEKKIVLE